jgi:hypothetical protein
VNESKGDGCSYHYHHHYYWESVNVERREASVWKRPKSALLSAVGAV